LTLQKNKVDKSFFVFRYLPQKEEIELLQGVDGVVVCYDFQAVGLCQGGWPASYATSKQQWWSLFKQYKSLSLYVNGSIYANAGADISQQLAYVLLHLNEYLNTLLQNKNKAPIDILVQLAFGSNYFFEIAKSHTFKILAENLFESYNFKVNLSLLGEPLQRNKCTMDYNVNLLRTTTEMMSAVLGEVDYAMNHPYDMRFNPPNDFADRMARNQLLLLKHESGFDQCSSPVGGSHYIAALIEQLSAQSWTQFLAQEAKGGWEKIVQSNDLQKAIFAVAEAEKARLRTGEQVLVGATKYQDSTSLNAVAKATASLQQYADFTPLTIQYLQE
jgi:methylmalonyl-CoA mutase